MANKVTFIINADHREAMNAFAQMDDAQRKQVLELARMNAEAVRAQAAIAKGARAARTELSENAREAANAKRQYDRLQDSAVRRTNLRYDGNLGMSGAQRELLRQGLEGGGGGRAGFSEVVELSAQRKAMAIRLRTERGSNRKAEAERLEMETRKRQYEAETANIIALRERDNRLQSEVLRRTNIRYDGNLGITQMQRQMGKQGGDSMFVKQIQEKQRLRLLEANKIRAERRSETQRISEENASNVSKANNAIVATAYSEIKRLRDKDTNERVSKIAPGMLGEGAIDFALRGGRVDANDSKYMTKARMTLAKNLRKMPELYGKVTEEQFNKMAEGMASELKAGADKWQRRMGSVTRGIGAVTGLSVIGGATAAVGLYKGFLDERQADSQAAADRVSSSRYNVESLKQISGSQQEYDKNLAEIEYIRTTLAMDATKAAKVQFTMNSMGLKGDDRTTALKAIRIGSDPETLAKGLQFLNTNYGTKIGMNEYASAALTATGNSMSELTGFTNSLGISAADFAAIGGTWQEQFAMQGMLANALKSDEAAGEAIKSLAAQLRQKTQQLVLEKNDKLKKGIALIDQMIEFEKQGKLRMQSNPEKSLSFSQFLGEDNAVRTALIYMKNVKSVRADADKITSQKGGANSAFNKAASFKNAKFDSSFNKDQAKQRLEVAQEGKLSLATNILNRIDYDTKAEHTLNDEELAGYKDSINSSLNRWLSGDKEVMYGRVFGEYIDDKMTDEERAFVMESDMKGMTRDDLQIMRNSNTRGRLDAYRGNQNFGMLPKVKLLRDQIIDEKLKLMGPVDMKVDPKLESQKVFEGLDILKNGSMTHISGIKLQNHFDSLVAQGYTNLTAAEYRPIAQKNENNPGTDWSTTTKGKDYLRKYGTKQGDQSFLNSFNINEIISQEGGVEQVLNNIKSNIRSMFYDAAKDNSPMDEFARSVTDFGKFVGKLGDVLQNIPGKDNYKYPKKPIKEVTGRP